MKILKELGATDSIVQVSKTQLLSMQKEMQKRLAQGERDPEVWQSLSILAEAMKIQFTQELFETQGVSAAYEYIQKLYKEAEITKVKATKNLVVDSDFKAASYKISTLIATSVGEEGIDIPAVDLIIFYEPVPSAIRTVQRRGRTGRMEKGKVIVLVTKGTRDEAYRWTAHHKENRMHRVLKDLKQKFTLQRPQEQQSLQSFNQKLKIYADSREKGSGVIKYLVDQNIDVRMQNLDVGDFLVSEKVGVERKEIRDFVDSIIDKRLLSQVKALKETFEKPLLVIEGTDDLYSVRKVHPNAIRGMLAWIAIDMKIPILYTKDFRDTAELLIILARREQEDKDGEFSIRGERKPLSVKELQ